MPTLYIPNEDDFRRWIKDAIAEYLESASIKASFADPGLADPLLNRKQTAGILGVSLATLHSWMKKGLPCHKQEGRVYFIRSEVLDYVKKNHRQSFEADSPTSASTP